MRRALIAAMVFFLAACGGSRFAAGPSAALPGDGGSALSSDLYVADQGLDAVVEFNAQGKKVGEVSFGPKPLDVVTDSHGNVYVLTAEDVVHKLTHNLGRVIGQYTPNRTYPRALTIDANDNLYVQAVKYSDASAVATRYPYGSSKPDKIYKVRFSGGGALTGISVRGNTLYFAAETDSPSPPTAYLWGCPIDGSGSCKFLLAHPIFFFYGCGFTTTAKYAAYGKTLNANAVDGFHPYTSSNASKARVVHLPKGYRLGTGFCNLHNYGSFVWGGMSPFRKSPPAEAAEFDLEHKAVHATVGAGVLRLPVAAYYGNGFTP